MVKIDAATSLENFRRFTIVSTCSSFAPESYSEDPEVFPERDFKEDQKYYVCECKRCVRHHL